MMTEPWPTELRYDRAARALHVAFDNGESFALPAEYLRVESPSAEIQGHGGTKTIVGGKQAVSIDAITPVGHYAVKLRFSDGHDTGIYSWAWLLKLGRGQATLWPAYLAALAQKGLSRT